MIPLFTDEQMNERCREILWNDFVRVVTLVLFVERCETRPDPHAAFNEVLTAWNNRANGKHGDAIRADMKPGQFQDVLNQVKAEIIRTREALDIK